MSRNEVKLDLGKALPLKVEDFENLITRMRADAATESSIKKQLRMMALITIMELNFLCGLPKNNIPPLKIGNVVHDNDPKCILISGRKNYKFSDKAKLVMTQYLEYLRNIRNTHSTEDTDPLFPPYYAKRDNKDSQIRKISRDIIDTSQKYGVNITYEDIQKSGRTAFFIECKGSGKTDDECISETSKVFCVTENSVRKSLEGKINKAGRIKGLLEKDLCLEKNITLRKVTSRINSCRKKPNIKSNLEIICMELMCKIELLSSESLYDDIDLYMIFFLKIQEIYDKIENKSKKTEYLPINCFIHEIGKKEIRIQKRESEYSYAFKIQKKLILNENFINYLNQMKNIGGIVRSNFYNDPKYPNRRNNDKSANSNNQLPHSDTPPPWHLFTPFFDEMSHNSVTSGMADIPVHQDSIWSDLPIKKIAASIDKKKIAYRDLGNISASKAIVIIPRAMSYGYYYIPLMQSLHDADVYLRVIDVRSHGDSGEKQFAYFDNFASLNNAQVITSDVNDHIMHIKAQNPMVKLVALGHSMGAGICGRYLETYGYHTLHGVIYVAPFFHNEQPGRKQFKFDLSKMMFSHERDQKLTTSFSESWLNGAMVKNFKTFRQKHSTKTLFLIGDKDELYDWRESLNIFKKTDNIDYNVISGSDHLTIISNVDQKIKDWLQNI